MRVPSTALVTGGAGFLGAHLCEALVATGVRVTAVDDLSTGVPANLARLRGDDRFHFVEGDVREPLPGQPELIINLACPASPPKYQADPVRTLMTSVLGTLRCLELAEQCGAVVLQASTSEIYGDPEQHPQSESYRGAVDPWSVRACYDEGKRAAETLCADFRRTRGVDARVVRIFNTYGPGMSGGDGRVVSNFLSQASSGRPLTVYGDGKATRCFCYVDDLVAGLIQLALLPELDGPVNLGSDREMTVLELVDEVRRVMGREVPIAWMPAATDDPKRRLPDLRRAQSLIDWNPPTQLQDGLRRTLTWFEQLPTE
ncbi:MAG: NAD-dependent epimerase/dehydratase family protein [Rhodobacterales bacterium]|nr:NAD-dependent epimerase/dehydratase family protein [Rhodobacterales bacterium]